MTVSRWRIAQVIAGVVVVAGGLLLTAYFPLVSLGLGLSRNAWGGRLGYPLLWATIFALIGVVLSILGIMGGKPQMVVFSLAAVVFVVVAALCLWIWMQYPRVYPFQTVLVCGLLALLTPWWSVAGHGGAKVVSVIALSSLLIWLWVDPMGLQSRLARDSLTRVNPSSPLAPSEQVCHDVAPELVARIENRLTIPGGGRLRAAQAVHSARDPWHWLVAAEVQGGDAYAGGHDIAIWSIRDGREPPTGSFTSSGPTSSVNGLAHRITGIPFGGESRLVQRVTDCAIAALYAD